MRVKMLVDAPGSPDGVTINEYAEGEVYDVPDDLGNVFLAEDFAELTDDDIAPAPVEEPEVSPEDEPDEKQDAGPAENK